MLLMLSQRSLFSCLHFFSMLGNFSTIMSSNIFSYPFFFSSSSRTPIIQTLMHLICPRGLFSFFFYFILFFRNYFNHFIFQLTDSFFCFRYSAIDSFQSIFNLNNCVVHLCILLFNSSRSLLIYSCIFSILFQDF